MTTVVRPYKGVSAEERRTERRERLIEAVFEVVLSEGVLGATVDKTCAEAGLTKRYFYESFGDLDTLLLAAWDTLFVRLYGDMRDAAAAHPDEDTRIRAVVSAVIADLAADPRGARLYVESPGHPGLRGRREEAVQAFTDFVAGHVLDPAHRDRGTELRIRLVVAGATDLITGFLGGTIPTDQAGVVDAVVRVATALQS